MPGTDPQPLPNVPLIHRPGDAAPVSLKRAPLAERKRLLVVDDEMPILRLVTRILATDNYEIQQANSGEAALSLLDQPDCPGVDLLVTDLMMPGINGRELAVIVRARFPHVRVLYVTGFADTLFKGLQELGGRVVHREALRDGRPARGDEAADVREDHRGGRANRSARRCGRVGR